MTSLYAKGGGAVQIAEQIAARIKGGTLRPGELLPPVRQLAAELEVNANTVASAYARLRDAGLVATRGRAGTVVLEPPLAAVSAAYTPRQVPAGMCDLASGNLDAALLPALALGAAEGFPQQNGYDISGDLPVLTGLGREWLGRQGVSLGSLRYSPARLTRWKGAALPYAAGRGGVGGRSCWPPLLTLLRHLRLRPLPLAMDEQGCRLPESGAAGAVILTPRAHNPTGASLSAQRAQQWRRFLSANPQCLAIVDDFWGRCRSSRCICRSTAIAACTCCR